jgi:hypothetical protein
MLHYGYALLMLTMKRRLPPLFMLAQEFLL